jgi:hypothetical protein
MKWITIKLGDILVAKFGVDQHVRITSLSINDMPIITRMPLVLPKGETMTIAVSEKPDA